MPITKTITLYSFDELSEQAQDKAIESLLDVNVDHGWWDYIYQDAANIGLRIDEFDLYRNTIKGELTEYLLDVCKSIRMNHGKDCDTFKTAANYHKAYIAAFVEWPRTPTSDWKPVDWLAEFKYWDEAQEIEADLTKALLEDYMIMLKKEYDWLDSREGIVSAIEANEYFFKEDGTLCTP
jgi:hypothetical protein